MLSTVSFAHSFCAGDGTSCQCLGGYLNFSPGDANAGVLCFVDDALIKQVDAAVAAVDALQAQLALSSCAASAQLGFGAWNAALSAYCSGNACPATAPESSVFAFLQANQAFSQSLIRTLNK